MLEPDTLIQRYLEGNLTQADAQLLDRFLEERPELGLRLIEHLEMEAMLRSTDPEVAEKIIRPALPPTRRFTFATVTSMAALAACITLLASWLLRPVPGPQPDEEATSASIAVLRSGVDLEWESADLTPGTQLSPGLLKLKSGIAFIEFYQGARVAIEGPAEFELISSGEATCTRGKLSATVPPQAIGFRINTPKGTIVDLGTEFGLDVSASNSEVHVFKGEVELHNAAVEMIREGQAISFAADSRIFAANPASFASLNEADALSASSERARLKLWQAQSAKMSSDPGLKLHFDFQDGKTTRSLRNHAPQGEDGSIVGTAWTEGRWPGKGALEFRNVSDRVRVSLPDETKALTMAMSVRVNSLDRQYNSLFMSDGWKGRKIHWQILRNGEIRLGVAVPAGSGLGHTYETPVYFTPGRFGSWVRLAVVFDPAANEVRHYADGILLARLPLIDSSPLKIGNAEIGNWNSGNKTEAAFIRHLSGAIDEFALWDRALSDAEIAALAK